MPTCVSDILPVGRTAKSVSSPANPDSAPAYWPRGANFSSLGRITTGRSVVPSRILSRRTVSSCYRGREQGLFLNSVWCRPTKSLTRIIAVALILMAMPIGVNITVNGEATIGAPFAHAERQGRGARKGNNGLGNGAEEGEDQDTGSDPSNPGRGGDHGGGTDGSGSDGDSSDGGDSEGSSSDGGSADGSGSSDSDSSEGSGDASSGDSSDGDQGSSSPGSSASAPTSSAATLASAFEGSSAQAGPDLAKNEEQDLISRGWE